MGGMDQPRFRPGKAAAATAAWAVAVGAEPRLGLRYGTHSAPSLQTIPEFSSYCQLAPLPGTLPAKYLSDV